MRLLQLIEYLASTNSPRQAKFFFDQYLLAAGFKHYAFTYYSGHIKTGRKLHFHCVSKALMGWHEYYLDQGYADVDRTLEENTTMVIPLFWDVHQQLNNAKNRRERRMRRESIEFGVDKGLSIPVYGPNYDFVSLTLHQFVGENCLNEYKTRMVEWQCATLWFYHHIKRILDLDHKPMSYALTKREKQCLELTARSWRVDKIARTLKITPRTVNFHIQNANKKLGTNNKYQTVNKYLQFNLE